MYKLSLYFLLILIYLGISRSFIPGHQGALLLKNEQYFQEEFTPQKDHLYSLILLDQFKSGLIIKTYYQKYLAVKHINEHQIIYIRTTKSFWNYSRPFLGMAMYSAHNERISLAPMPPGYFFVGNLELGEWKTNPETQEEFWEFYPTYAPRFAKLFGWNQFKPTYKSYKQANLNEAEKLPYHGPNNEFGTDKELTTNFLKTKNKNERFKKISWNIFFQQYYASPAFNLKKVARP